MERAFALAGLLALALALLVFSGCVQPDISDLARELPEIKEVLEKQPNARVESLFMRKDVAGLVIDDIRRDCGQEMAIASYWYVTVKTSTALAEFYLDETGQRVLCSVLPPELLDQCSSALECDDLDPATKDECKGSPKKCENTPITQCENQDGYCPAKCDYSNDNDCPAIDQCNSNFECTDSNRFTKDVCDGTPKVCSYSLKSCAELNENLCQSFEACKGNALPTTDRGVCCNQPCVKTETCEGVTCPAEQKCVRGNCIDKSCAERELPLCAGNELCTEELYKDDFGITCCTGECRKPCDTDSNCSSEEICKADSEYNYCIAKSCADIDGKTCSATEKCTGEIEKTLDNEACCLECSPKKCWERNGIVCDSSKGKACTRPTIETLDEQECCLAECEYDWCVDRPCAINKKCVEEECVLKTCEEMHGIDWVDEETCGGNFYITSGLLDCCILNTCEELGGLECLETEECEAPVLMTSDTNSCCTEECLE